VQRLSKICVSCGKEYKGEFCEHCGYGDPKLKTHAADKYRKKSNSYVPPDERGKKPQSSGGRGKKRDPKQVRLLIVFAVALALLIGWTLAGSGLFGAGNSSAEVVNTFFRSVNERDFGKYAGCHSKEQKNAIIADLRETGLSEREYMDEFRAPFAEEYGSDFVVSYKILSTEKMQSYSMDEYRAAYGSVPTISEAECVVLDVTFEGSAGSETFRMHAYTAHIGLSWRLMELGYAPGVISAEESVNS
jgi:hypothetical protein